MGFNQLVMWPTWRRFFIYKSQWQYGIQTTFQDHISLLFFWIIKNFHNIVAGRKSDNWSYLYFLPLNSYIENNDSLPVAIYNKLYNSYYTIILKSSFPYYHQWKTKQNNLHEENNNNLDQPSKIKLSDVIGPIHHYVFTIQHIVIC